MSDVIDYDGFFRVASAGRADEVRSFLEAGANLRYRNRKGVTVAHLASAKGRLEALKLMLDSGLCPNVTCAGDKTPLHTAVASGFDEVVGALVRAGADIGATDKAGRTPLHCARFFTTVKRLLSLGANPELCDADGRKPLDRFQAMGLGGDTGASLAILLQGSLLTPA